MVPHESYVQKVNFASETAGLVSQNRLIKEFYLDGSGHSNEEEPLKTDYAAVDDYDATVDKSPNIRAWISALANSNGVLDGSEHINEE